MKYLLFGGEFYYAKGGFHDFIISSDDLGTLIEPARKTAEDTVCHFESLDWWHIVDSETGKIVAGTESQAYGADDLDGERLCRNILENHAIETTIQKSLSEVTRQIKTLQEIVLIMIKGGCPKEHLENKILSLESEFYKAE